MLGTSHIPNICFGLPRLQTGDLLMFPGEITHVVVETLDGDPEVSWHEIERDVLVLTTSALLLVHLDKVESNVGLP